MKHWIGIDISKAELVVCVMDDQQKVHHATFTNNKAGFRSLSNYLKKRVAQDSAVCLEATGIYGDDLAEYLHGRGYQVSVVNPLRIKRYAESQLRRNKTDAVDAAIIADFCRTQSPLQWTPPDAAWLELRALVRRMDDLISIQIQEKQRLETIRSATVQRQVQAHIAYLESQIEQLLQQIKDHIDQDPKLKQQRDLLNTIPGISDKTSSRLLAEIRDIPAFETVEQLVAYIGLNPRQRQSGTYRGQVKISKLGSVDISS